MVIDPTNPYNQENEQDNQEERFESDTQRIIHRHLSNPDDIITDEDIQKIRIGMTPPPEGDPEEVADRFEEELNITPIRRNDEEPTEEPSADAGTIPPTPWETVKND